MFSGKLTRQDVFNRVWHHYIVEGYPYALGFEKRDGILNPRIVIKTEKHLSPLGLLLPASKYNKGLEQTNNFVIFNKLRPFVESHVDFDFVHKLETFYEKTVKFAFEGVNLDKVRDYYARKYRRAFRKTLRFYLISFAMDYDLTIPGERPITVHARKAARDNKD
jgi:hypothetical protein